MCAKITINVTNKFKRSKNLSLNNHDVFNHQVYNIVLDFTATISWLPSKQRFFYSTLPTSRLSLLNLSVSIIEVGKIFSTGESHSGRNVGVTSALNCRDSVLISLRKKFSHRLKSEKRFVFQSYTNSFSKSEI